MNRLQSEFVLPDDIRTSRARSAVQRRERRVPKRGAGWHCGSVKT
jgi:hypothetical protein